MIDTQPIPVTRPSSFLKVYDFDTGKYIWVNLDMICSVEMPVDDYARICLADGDTLLVNMTEDEAKLNLMSILPAGYAWRNADESCTNEDDIS